MYALVFKTPASAALADPEVAHRVVHGLLRQHNMETARLGLEPRIAEPESAVLPITPPGKVFRDTRCGFRFAVRTERTNLTVCLRIAMARCTEGVAERASVAAVSVQPSLI